VLNSGYNCLSPEETIEHMLFHCQFNRKCWATLNLHWHALGNRLQIIEQGRTQWAAPMFMKIFIVGGWSIWKEIDNMLFNNVAPNVES
jgi:hypothetical protein